MEHHKETFTLRTLVHLLTGIAQTYPVYHPVRYHDGNYLVLCETTANQRASYLFYRLENNTFLFCGRVLVSHGRIYLSSAEGGEPCHRRIPESTPLHGLKRDRRWRELYKAAIALCELDPLWISPSLTEDELETYYD